jgi:LEA14-like dessication related protein
MKNIILFSVFMIMISCLPKEEIVLKDIQNIEMKTAANGDPLLSGNAIFHNPNKTKMMLRQINIEIFVDGKKAAHSDQKLDANIPARNDFTVPLEVKLNLQEIGLNTLFGFLTGKKHEVRFLGSVRVKVHGVVVKIPVDYKSDLKLNI